MLLACDNGPPQCNSMSAAAKGALAAKGAPAAKSCPGRVFGAISFYFWNANPIEANLILNLWAEMEQKHRFIYEVPLKNTWNKYMKRSNRPGPTPWCRRSRIEQEKNITVGYCSMFWVGLAPACIRTGCFRFTTITTQTDCCASLWKEPKHVQLLLFTPCLCQLVRQLFVLFLRTPMFAKVYICKYVLNQCFKM